ncbi:hypothetical protein AN643_02815 [Candidatus Epulonipiscioides saccharophilum]|nr:hypothetical protein AN643_02815 [Epulopiscium sp. SCG-B10WGA-EpuloB]
MIVNNKKWRLQLTVNSIPDLTGSTITGTNNSVITVGPAQVNSSLADIDMTISNATALASEQTLTVTLTPTPSASSPISLTFKIRKEDLISGSSLHSIAQTTPTDNPTHIASALTKPSLAKNMIGKISHALKGVFARL